MPQREEMKPGFKAFNEWSRKWPEYDEADTRKAWDSFKPHSIGAGTLFHLARNADCINELVALDPMEYDQCREKQANKLNVRVRTLDQMVAKRRQALEVEAAVDALGLDHWAVEPWPEPVETKELLVAIEATIKRYIATLGKRSIVPSLWVMMTWVHEAAAVHSPILLAWSPHPDSGKTTLAGLISFLSWRGLASVNISSAVLFRLVDQWKPTLIVDEADTAFAENNDLRGVINSGWTRGQQVFRCDPDTHEPRGYATFAPKMVAMKGKSLPDTTLTRCIALTLKRKMPNERVEDFDHIDDDHLSALRSKLARWARDYAEIVRETKPEDIPDFHNRLRMNWSMLLTIAEMAGEQERAREAAREIEGVAADERAVTVSLLSDIKQVFDEEGDPLLSATLVGALNQDPDKQWCEYHNGKPLSQNMLARLLREYAIAPDFVTEGGVRGSGYKRRQFEEAWDRYLPKKPTNGEDGVREPENSPDNLATLQKPMKSALPEGSTTLQTDRDARLQKREKPSIHGTAHSCKVVKAEKGSPRPQTPQAALRIPTQRGETDRTCALGHREQEARASKKSGQPRLRIEAQTRRGSSWVSYRPTGNDQKTDIGVTDPAS